MYKNTITKEQLEWLHSKINIPITYKQMCDIAGFPYLSGSGKTSFLKALELWCEYEKTTSPTKYIFLKFYDKKKELLSAYRHCSSDEDDYKWAEEFFIKRKITPIDDLPFPLRSRQKIAYTCEFHPNIIHETTWGALKISIGCPSCQYPYSRFEIMMCLGIEGAENKVKFDGVEFDVYIPHLNTVVEYDGYYFHRRDTEEHLKRKTNVAENNGLRFLRVEEVLDNEKIGIEGDVLYVTPYANVPKKERKKIIRELSKFVPFVYREGVWNEAADYMRQNQTFPNLNSISLSQSIEQRDLEGNLINTYAVKELISEMLAKEEFLGYRWTSPTT